jgi:RNA polymerase sigma-70 factor (ECF subfamily)
MEDKQIIELYFARNEQAIAETDKKYGAYCRAIAYRILEDRLDSEEVANDTYLRLWTSIPPKEPDPLKPYVGRISRNLALDVYDTKHAAKRSGITLALEELAECLPAADGREIGESAALSDSLSRFISALDKRERIIFVRRYFYLCKISEISQELALKESTVAMTLGRTRKKLRRHLEREGFAL